MLKSNGNNMFNRQLTAINGELRHSTEEIIYG